MSVVGRVVMAGLACAALVSVQAAPTVARAQAAANAGGGDDPARDTRGRFVHASKCVATLGFGGGCDKDAPAAKADRAVVTEASTEPGTRRQFMHASKCVMTMGFGGGCHEPLGSESAASRSADAAPKAPDTSTRGQFFHASKCVVTLGFVGDCERK